VWEPTGEEEEEEEASASAAAAFRSFPFSYVEDVRKDPLRRKARRGTITGDRFSTRRRSLRRERAKERAPPHLQASEKTSKVILQKESGLVIDV